MHISNRKAVSTLTLIVLMLCSAVFGALVSYLWVMSSYYNMPENTTLLIVEDVVFPVFNARYFNVTILNPSNSISDTNIMAIRLSVEGKEEVYDVTTADPSLPFPLRRGTKQTFKCIKNWSYFAGETVRIEPVAANASTKSYSYATPRVKLKLTPNFDVSQSIEYFNLTLENYASIINLTISEIRVFGFSINVTPTLPHVLPPDQIEIFRCNWNWENVSGENVTVTVKTSEGYESAYVTNELLGAVLYIDEVGFDYTDTKYFNLTISSSEYSTATAIINRVNLTLPDEETITLNTTPPLDIIPIPIPRNNSLTIRCLWDWNTYRNETVTVRAYTKQGFTAPSKNVITPPAIVWNITDVKFDLDDIEHFSVNVTNMLCSLQSINVIQIKLDENVTSITPSSGEISADEERRFSCEFNWTSFRGETVTVTVYTAEGLNISKSVMLPSIELKISDELAFAKSTAGILYVNITVLNTVFSAQNVTITQIIFETENATDVIDGTLTSPKLIPDGYVLLVDANVTIVCPWNWTLYPNQDLTITLQTAEGFSLSQTFQIPESAP